MFGACRRRSSGRRKRGASPLRAEVGAAEETCCRVLPQLLTGVLPDLGEECMSLGEEPPWFLTAWQAVVAAEWLCA